jgi:hypothetical protein
VFFASRTFLKDIVPSLGKFIFEAFRKRISGDPKVSAVVRAAVQEANKSGVNLVEPTVVCNAAQHSGAHGLHLPKSVTSRVTTR